VPAATVRRARTTSRMGPEGIIASMDDLKLRLADAQSKLSHVKEYL
jgi:hypothetical protein